MTLADGLIGQPYPTIIGSPGASGAVDRPFLGAPAAVVSRLTLQHFVLIAGHHVAATQVYLFNDSKNDSGVFNVINTQDLEGRPVRPDRHVRRLHRGHLRVSGGRGLHGLVPGAARPRAPRTGRGGPGGPPDLGRGDAVQGVMGPGRDVRPPRRVEPDPDRHVLERVDVVGGVAPGEHPGPVPRDRGPGPLRALLPPHRVRGRPGPRPDATGHGGVRGRARREDRAAGRGRRGHRQHAGDRLRRPPDH